MFEVQALFRRAVLTFCYRFLLCGMAAMSNGAISAIHCS
jgi:hypothetical protein